MLTTASEVYKVIDPMERDVKWMDDCVSSLRRDWQPLVNSVSNVTNKEMLFSKQPMDFTKSMFKDKGDFLKNHSIKPLPLLENIKNSMIEEILKAPPKMEIKANDPTSLTKKQADMVMLRYKSLQEKIINDNNKKVGDPSEVIGHDKFHTNIEDFFRMGLNPDDAEDISFYEQNDFPKLKYEIAGQKLVDIILKLNRFDEETTEQFVVDILANKAICMDIFVDKITGELKMEYLYPETFYGIFGTKSDGRDDVAKGYEKSVTVNQFLEKVGNSFVWETDWQKLLWAINFRNGSNYTGFRRGSIDYSVFDTDGCAKSMGLEGAKANIMDWAKSYAYEVYLGKIQFKVPHVTATYLKSNGKTISEVPYGYQISTEEETKKYQTESYYQQQVYECYYISTSAVGQYIFNWGKATYQELYGANDEYANGGLWYMRSRGKSAVELAQPYIQIVNDAFYKMVWAVYEAHPDHQVYQVEELAELAKIMYSKAGVIGAEDTSKSVNSMQNQLTGIIKYFNDNLVKLKTIPRVDGKAMLNMNNTPSTEKRGLDPIAIAMQSVCLWAENQLKEKMGFNDLRAGNVEDPREGLGQNKLAAQGSKNATGYVFRMVGSLKERVCTSTLIKAQDIVRFKESAPYKWIRTLLGEENFANLKLLDDFAAHRYGITVENYNAQMERQFFIQLVEKAMDTSDGRGGIDPLSAMTLIMEEDYKSGMKKLTYMKYRAEKKKRAQEMEMMKQQQQNIMEQKKADSELEDKVQAGKMAVVKMTTDANIKIAQMNNQTKEKIKTEAHTFEPMKQDAKADSQSRVVNAKAQADNQKSLI